MSGRRNKLLVLVGQGVVFDAPIKRFLANFANDYQLSHTDIEARWESGLREQAWRGLIEDEPLWNALAGRPVDAAQMRRCLDASYRPGPAAAYIADWSSKAQLWLLSNHRRTHRDIHDRRCRESARTRASGSHQRMCLMLPALRSARGSILAVRPAVLPPET